MAKKKSSSSSKKKATKRKKKKVETPSSIFRSHALKIGIPEEGSTFDDDELIVVWNGVGEICRKIVPRIEEIVRSKGFSEVEIDSSEEFLEDPVTEILRHLNLSSKKRSESIFRLSNEEWTATVMLEHCRSEFVEEDSAIVMFLVSEKEE